MSLFLLIWLAVAVILEYLLVVAPLDIKVWWKKGIYYVVLAPYLALIYIKGWLGQTNWFAPLSNWFKKVD